MFMFSVKANEAGMPWGCPVSLVFEKYLLLVSSW